MKHVLDAYKTDPPQYLTLTIGGTAVGAVVTSHILPNGVLGMLTPLPGLEPYLPLFEGAVEMSRQLDAFSPGLDYSLYDRLCAEFDKIAALGSLLAERPEPILEFSVWSDWTVEIMFWFPKESIND